MKRHLQCAEQQVSPSNLTKYCACHEKWLDCFIVLTYETSFPMRGATGVTIQPHQILRLPRKMTLQDFKENLQKQMKRHFQCGADPSMIRPWSDHDPTMKTQTATRLASEVTFRAHHEHFLLKNTTFRAQSYIQTFTKYCACHVKCHLNFTKYCACHAERLTYLVLIAYETSFTVRGATGVTIQPHQILRLPRKMTRLLYRPHIWNVISNARSNRCHHPTSPNTAPATKNDSTALSSSHMKRHFQCAEQQVSPSNLTKYCACHEKWLDCFIVLTYETSFPMRGATGVTIQPHQILRLPRKMTLQDFKENLQKQMKRHFQCGADPSMIRPWSDHDPTMKTQTATRLASEVTFRAHHEHFLLKNTTFRAQSYIQTFTKYCACHVKCHLNFTKYCACHAERLTYLVLIAYETSFTVRGATGVTIQPHQILRLPRKMTRLLYRPHIWNVISNARSNRCHHPTSPNTAPATKNDSTALSSSHMKRHFQCAEQQVSLSNLTKYCACHEKWHCKISKHDPTMKTQTATRLASEVTFRAHHEHFLLKNTTFRAQSYIQTFTKYCACHVKCHLNFTKYCACHEKWHLNFTKYCACHEKWHLNFTKYCAGHCTVTELYCTLLYLTLLYVTLLYVTLLYVTLLYLTLLYLTLLYLTLLDTTLRDTTLRDTTLLDSTLLDSTLLDSTWHYSTWHYSTWLLFYLTLLYLTCSTWLNLTEMLFRISEVSQPKLPLIINRKIYIYIYTCRHFWVEM